MSDSKSTDCCRCELTAAFLILRLWIGLRLFFAGLDKFRAGSGVDTSYSWENYSYKMGKIAENVANNSFLPDFMCTAYAMPLGFILLLSGIAVLIGFKQRIALFIAGLTFVSLSFGLMVLPDDTETLFLGLHVLITAAALALVQHDRFSLDSIFGKKKA